MLRPAQKSIAQAALVGCCLFIAVTFAYLQGTSGDLFYDDVAFLSPLQEIQDSGDVAQFLADGNAGPLGRPIALLSFIPHADGWPETADQARIINVLIHIANGILLLVLGYQIARLTTNLPKEQCLWLSLGAVALWISLPILASTTLITVQRWTSLSTLFGLFGLTLFVAGYFLQRIHAAFSLTFQLAVLGIFTLLSIYTKEIGALFPVYALVIDAVVLKNHPAPSVIRIVRRAVLFSGLAIMLVYLSPLYRDWWAVSDFRGWSSWDRVQTQMVILWQYLLHTFLPQPSAFGPFNDHFVIQESGLKPLLGFAAFTALTTLAYAYRNKNPWPLFALLWFFVGHLIESTVILLELYFEHRNYLAVYGFMFSLAIIVWQLPTRMAQLGKVFIAGYAALLWVVLLATTSVWGDPINAAENWAHHNPNSPRAVMHLSAVYHREIGSPSLSLQAIDRYATSCKQCTHLKMQALIFSCLTGDSEDTKERYKKLNEISGTGSSSIATIDGFYPLQEYIHDGKCPPINEEMALETILNLLNNPNFRAWQYQVHLLFHAAYFTKELGRIDEALGLLEQAEERRPQIMPILQMQVHLLIEQGRYAEALDKIEARRLHDNRDRFMSDTALDELAAEVEKVQGSPSSQGLVLEEATTL